MRRLWLCNTRVWNWLLVSVRSTMTLSHLSEWCRWQLSLRQFPDLHTSHFTSALTLSYTVTYCCIRRRKVYILNSRKSVNRSSWNLAWKNINRFNFARQFSPDRQRGGWVSSSSSSSSQTPQNWVDFFATKCKIMYRSRWNLVQNSTLYVYFHLSNLSLIGDREFVQVLPNLHFWSDFEYFSVLPRQAPNVYTVNVTAFAVTSVLHS